MVKIVLIGKNGRAQCKYPATWRRFVGLEFILNELRVVMVNRALPSRQPELQALSAITSA
jgi:hypothetical protein